MAPSTTAPLVSVADVLRRALAEAARDLGVPLALPGDTFFPPPGPWLRASVALEDCRAAALGPLAPSRVDGALDVEAAVPAPSGALAAEALAGRLAARFPRGRGLPAARRGEVVFGEPFVGAARCDGARLLAPARLPFYAILF